MSITDNIAELSSDEHLVNVGRWNQAHPEAFRAAFAVKEEYGGGVAIGWHSEIGWYVIHDQGFGAGLVWNEKAVTGSVRERLRLVPKPETERSTPRKFPWSKPSSSEEDEGDATQTLTSHKTLKGTESKEVREEEG